MSTVAVELRNGHEGVRLARQAVAEHLEGLGLDELVDDTQVVVTELVTNALLHAGPSPRLVLEALSHGVRVEVHDGSRVPPVLLPVDAEGMTGRGLRLVDALTTGWGFARTPDGKRVWAELSIGTAGREPELSSEEIMAAWVEEDFEARATPRYRVMLGEVPTDLLLSAKAHVDNLVREFTLAAAGARSGTTPDMPPHLASLVETVVTRFAEARQAIKRQAIEAAHRGLSHVRLELELPASAADAGEDYLRGLDEADEYCRAARLLTLEAPPQHKVFRRWYIEELVMQLRAAAAGLPAERAKNFEERLLDEVGAVAEAQWTSDRTARLHSLAAALVGALTPEAVAHAVLVEGVAALAASGGGVLLAGDADRLGVPAAIGYDEEVVARLRQESRRAELPAAVALRTGQAVWLESREERDARFPALVGLERTTVSMCAVPLEGAGRRLGALRFSFTEPRLFAEDDRRFVMTLAAHTAQALDRAQLYQQRSELSRRLQRSLLPPELPSIPGLDIAARYHPLGDGMELGGDFYDLWACESGGWAVAIGDACGTGPEAAALTAMVRVSLRALSMTGQRPADVLHQLNSALSGLEPAGRLGERFSTVLFGPVLPVADGFELTLATGGHPAPLLRRRDGAVEELPLAGTLLGLLADVDIGVHTTTLRPGELLLLYTDGATEARRRSLGAGGLVRVLADAGGDAAAVADQLEQSVIRQAGGQLHDDLALLVLRVPE